MIRIAIVEDNAALRYRLKDFIDTQENFLCVFTASSLEELFEHYQQAAAADVLLLDILLDTQNSLDYLAQIKHLLPDTKIIVLTGYQEPEYLTRAIQQGASSYYLKSSDPDKLTEVIETTVQGGAYFDPFAMPGFINHYREQSFNPFNRTYLQQHWQLNKREIEMAEGIYAGKTYKEIAAESFISLDTARHYIKSLYKKLDVHDKTQLIHRLQNMTTS